MNSKLFGRLAIISVLLAVVVVILGAYTRLGDAGLGCPDWPGCYGHLDVPEAHHEIAKANQAYPERPVEPAKAWKEMIHRYFAGTLGLLVFFMAAIAIKNRNDPNQQVAVPVFLAFWIVFQALLGMWTVTIKLNPTIVMAHLMGGLTTLSLLFWISLRHTRVLTEKRLDLTRLNRLHMFSLIALIVVVFQIMLGGWTSSNYAALACGDYFPMCQAKWWPAMDFKEGFVMWRGTEQNFEFGVLQNDARIAIQMTHRIGALITTIVLITLAFKLIDFRESKCLGKLGTVLLIVLIFQLGLGVANIILSLPMTIAVMHNAVGAMLLLVMVAINHAIRPKAEAL
ncbi:MAG: COX15/CtaA family protein [Gammaproteobacteria bacterium]|nr:COX15/CtaA family protein [Gammaproteobacteria bacterium]